MEKTTENPTCEKCGNNPVKEPSTSRKGQVTVWKQCQTCISESRGRRAGAKKASTPAKPPVDKPSCAFCEAKDVEHKPVVSLKIGIGEKMISFPGLMICKGCLPFVKVNEN